MEEIIGKGKIKDGANCGQDFGYFVWPRHEDEKDTEFTFYDVGIENRFRAVADGYGCLSKPNAYGNGSIYVKKDDIIWGKIIEGTWAEDDIRRAFVAGAKWWEYRSAYATMWQSSSGWQRKKQKNDTQAGNSPSNDAKLASEGLMKPYYQTEHGTLYLGDAREALRALPSESVNCCVTSPPYWGLRDYGVDGQIGLERTPDEFVARLVEVFREVRRVLRDDGTLWLNLGDSYCGAGAGGGGNKKGNEHGQHDDFIGKGIRGEIPNGLKPKDLVGIPWMVAFALRADGWYLRQDIIWHKPNQMPESVTDRCTKAHEYLFLLSKSERYHCDMEAIQEKADPSNYRYNSTKRETPPGQKKQGRLDSERGLVMCNSRNRRSVWAVATQPFASAHFATFPPKLIEPCILAGCPQGGVVLDPFMGSGTTAVVAYKHGRKFVGTELSQKYLDEITIPRIEAETKQMRLFEIAG